MTIQFVSYPVPKEVGKVGTNSPTYIEPVSERKDGIASLFKRQEEKGQGSSSAKSPAKPKVEVTRSPLKPKVEALTPNKTDKVHSPVKADSKDVKGVEGLGDDSNAPQSQVGAGKGKRKAKEEAREEPVSTPRRQSKRIKATEQDKKAVEVKSESDDGIEVLDEAEFKQPKENEKPDAAKIEVSRLARKALKDSTPNATILIRDMGNKHRWMASCRNSETYCSPLKPILSASRLSGSFKFVYIQ